MHNKHNQPTHPGEVDLRGSFAHRILEANRLGAERSQDPIAHDPRLKLDTESAADYFGLNAQQKETLSPDSKRALTVLVWEIDNIIERKPVPTEAERELNVQYAKDMGDVFGGVDIVKEYDDHLRKHPAAVQDAEFAELVGQCVDMADLVVRGNYMLTEFLSARYDEVLEYETGKFGLGRESDPVLEAKRRIDEEHGLHNKPSDLFKP